MRDPKSRFQWSVFAMMALLMYLIPCPVYSGTPHVIYGQAVSEDGGVPGEEELEIYAYRPVSPEEILDRYSVGCGYGVFAGGWLWFEAGNFVRPWSENDSLRIVIIDPVFRETGAADITVDSSGSQKIPDLQLSAGDHVGPIAYDAMVYDANAVLILAGTETIPLFASLDDVIFGNSDIQGAEYFVDTDPGLGSGMPMEVIDGAFDSPEEDVMAAVDASGWEAGSSHTIYVRGRDWADNWGTTHQAEVAVVKGQVGRYSLTVRVYIDYRCDTFFKTGVDRPLADVPVTLAFSDGARLTRKTRRAGLVYFYGIDPAGGIRITTELPGEYRGYPLEICHTCYETYELEPDDFGAFHNKWIEFRAKMVY